MNPALALIRMRVASLRNGAQNVGKDSIAKVFVVLFGLGNVIGIGYWVSAVSFRFIESFPAFGASLNAKIVALLFFALFVLVVLSTVIVTYSTVFLARETDYLFQHPIPPRTIFFLKLAEAIAFSSWATLFLCMPVLVAFGVLRKAGPLYYLQCAGILSAFLMFAGFTGATISLLLAPVLRRLTPLQFLGLGAMALVLLGWTFLYSFGLWGFKGDNNLLLLDRFTSRLTAMHSPYFPSQWASAAVLAAAAGNHREVLFHGSTLLANTLLFLPMLAWYSDRLYGRQWVSLRGFSAPDRKGPIPVVGTPAARAAQRGPLAWRALGKGPLPAITLKDVLLFARDPAQVSQSILFLVLMVIYSLSLLNIPDYFSSPTLRLVIYFANLGAVCMILSSFTSRFLFPLISLEGRAFWILGLAPLPRTYLLHQKAFFGLGVSLFLGIVLVTVSNAVLNSTPGLFLGAIYTMFLAAVCLTALSTGLGSAYPVLDEDNPARIAVGLGGTLNFFASALSLAVLITLQAFPYLIFGVDPGPWVGVSHLLSLAFTGLLSAFAFGLGARALARREF